MTNNAAKKYAEIMASRGVEGLETPVVQDEQIDPRQRLQEPGVASIATGKRQFVEQLWDAGVENGAVVTAGFCRLIPPSGKINSSSLTARRAADGRRRERRTRKVPAA